MNTLVVLDCFGTDQIGEVMVVYPNGREVTIKNVDTIEVSDQFLHVWHSRVCSCFKLEALNYFHFTHNLKGGQRPC